MKDRAIHQVYLSVLNDALKSYNTFLEEFGKFHDELHVKNKELFKRMEEEDRPVVLSKKEIDEFNNKTYEFREKYDFLENLFERVDYFKLVLDESKRSIAKEEELQMLYDWINNKIDQLDTLVDIFQIKKHPLVMFSQMDGHSKPNMQIPEPKNEFSFMYV